MKTWSERRAELDSYTHEELLEHVKNIYNNPAIGIYFSIRTQIEFLAIAIETDEDISLKGTEFKNFILWCKEALEIHQSMELLKAALDPEELAAAQQEKLKAHKGSLEERLRKLEQMRQKAKDAEGNGETE